MKFLGDAGQEIREELKLQMEMYKTRHDPQANGRASQALRQ